MSDPKKDDKKKDDRKEQGGSSRPGTKLMEPPTRRKPHEEDQVPAGDDSDINEGKDFIEPEDMHDDRPPKKRTENKPVEKGSRSDENSGCAC
ncbi:MAG TPA: hypothetical protein VE981_22455 [Planctomycetota bacterium]|nr:hypothetical protein [Planctomycetota bacterium]